MDKQEQINQAWEEFKNPVDLQEWLEYVNSDMEYDLCKMDDIEEGKLSNYFDRPPKGQVMENDNYWSPESPNYMGYYEYEDHYMYMEDLDSERRRVAELECSKT